MMNTPPVLILAGGLGTRLRKVIKNTPKVLVPVNGRPFVELLINNLSKQGVNEIILLTGYLGELVDDYIFKSKIDKKLNLRINTIKEDVPLGTGGAVANAVNKLSLTRNFIIINGDTWMDNFYKKLFNNSLPTLGLVKVKDISRYGHVEVNNLNNKVTSFSEKNDNRLADWVNSGAFYTKPTFFKKLNKKNYSLEKDLLPILVNEGLLNAIKLETSFIDIGIPSDYKLFVNQITNKA